MRDVIFPLPGLAAGDEFRGTVIFKKLSKLELILYYFDTELQALQHS